MSKKKLKLPISVCILVKNEEDHLINSLSPLSIFEEVLVYDSGSKDKSVEICEQFGAKIISGQWVGFSESRKILFSEATQPWIFWLDADEVVTSELASEL
ncbi:MAG TPA: glycosyltransferase family 2 protein, partial [Opitutae bacterium]|nr:glycosyltransferase family 2 protein [Opitutae bacterium]